VAFDEAAASQVVKVSQAGSELLGEDDAANNVVFGIKDA